MAPLIALGNNVATAAFKPSVRWRLISVILAVAIPFACVSSKGLPASTAASCFASPTKTTLESARSASCEGDSPAWLARVRQSACSDAMSSELNERTVNCRLHQLQRHLTVCRTANNLALGFRELAPTIY